MGIGISYNPLKGMSIGSFEFKGADLGSNPLWRNKPEPITVDITGAPYVVPDGYTLCEYVLIADSDNNGGSINEVVIRKNNTAVDSIEGLGYQRTDGYFAVAGGDNIRGEVYGVDNNYVTITLT